MYVATIIKRVYVQRVLDGTNIPSGAAIGISSCAMGQSDSLWGEDVSEFRPERFLEKNEPTVLHSSFQRSTTRVREFVLVDPEH